MFLGKILGAVVGFLLFGPLGALLGIFFGHQLDQTHWFGWQKLIGATNETQRVLLNTIFSVLGHLAKADGRVSEAAIQITRQIMRRLNLNATQTQQAMTEFKRGKQPNFDLKTQLHQFQQHTQTHPFLKGILVQILEDFIHQLDKPSLAQRNRLQTIYQLLQINSGAYHQSYHSHRDHTQQNSTRATTSLQEAYALLEIQQTATPTEVKRAYRKKISQFHPDKMVAKKLPDEMIKIATQKTQHIQAAYELIRGSRGF